MSYNALCTNWVLPSTGTLTNICHKKYSLTVDAIKKQLSSRNKVSLALDGWTATNILCITFIIAYHMDQDCTLQEVQLAFDQVEYHFISLYKGN
jgi:hypothetical protein